MIKATKHIADEVNGLKKMSSEELTQTVDVLQNVKEKIQNFNTSKKEAGELITVRERSVEASVLMHFGLVHTTPEESSFISTVRPTVHTDPSRKRSFSKTFFKPGKVENAGFAF